MKILHINFSLTNGGLENLLIDVVNLQAKDNEVRMMIINDLYEKELLKRVDPAVPVKLYNRRPQSPFVLTAFKTFLFILRYKPDIIHIHTPSLILPAILFKKRVVCTIHNVKIDSRPVQLNQNLIAISRSVQADIEKRYRKRST